MIWDFILWFLQHWYILIWMAGVVVAYIYGGRSLAFVVLTLGVGAVAYNKGKTDKSEHAKNVEERRKNAYDEIDNRDTNADNVIERLRKHGF